MELGLIADIDLIQICTAILAPGKLQTSTTNSSDHLKLQYEESVKLHCTAEAPAARHPQPEKNICALYFVLSLYINAALTRVLQLLTEKVGFKATLTLTEHLLSLCGKKYWDIYRIVYIVYRHYPKYIWIWPSPKLCHVVPRDGSVAINEPQREADAEEKRYASTCWRSCCQLAEVELSFR